MVLELELFRLLPELVLTAFGLLVMLVDVFLPRGQRRLLGNVALIGVLGALAATVTHGLNPEHAFGPEHFAAMKKTAYFINVGRGALVDEKALVAALEERSIAGAAIDVAETEPLAADSPLWSAPNLFITPHLAGVSERLWHRHAALLLDNLERYFAGKELLNVVDKERGY